MSFSKKILLKNIFQISYISGENFHKAFFKKTFYKFSRWKPLQHVLVAILEFNLFQKRLKFNTVSNGKKISNILETANYIEKHKQTGPLRQGVHVVYFLSLASKLFGIVRCICNYFPKITFFSKDYSFYIYNYVSTHDYRWFPWQCSQ